MFTGKSLLIATVGALIIGFVGGINAGALFPSTQIGGSGLSKAQLEKVKKFFPVTPEIKTLSGTIRKIEGKTITFEVAESNNPFDEWPTSRKVTVSDTTKIIKIVQKDPKEFQKEIEAYSPGVIGDPTKPSSFRSPPNPAKEETAKLSDLKVGDVVTVESDHNIKSETQFTATKISIGTGGSMGSLLPSLPMGMPAGNLPTPPPASAAVPSTGNLPTPPPVR